MKRAVFSWLALACLTVTATTSPASAQQYTAAQNGDLIQLADTRSQTVVSIITSVGNIAYEMNVKGQNILRFPFATVDAFRAKPTGLHGIPLLAPWANRLDEQAFYANGARYAFDMQLGNVTGEIPIHGFMSRTDQWQVIEVKSDGTSAWVISRLDAYKRPAWMKQWPFAHTIEMTYRLRDGILENYTKVTNLAAEPMPVSLGYHPYFQLTDSPRDEWTITVPARTRWLLSDKKIPTGEIEPIDKLFPGGKGVLKGYNLDDVFSDLTRDSQGRATVTVRGRAQQLDVMLGPNYRSLVIYSSNPNPTPNFICFEPMTGITNALNLAHRGVYKDLQYIKPGGTWEERFWVRPSGF
jgi:aldose 1-epimerase